MYENEEEVIDLMDIIAIIRKKLLFVITLPIITGIIGLIVSIYLIKPIYEASTTLMVNSSKASTEVMSQTDVNLSKSLVYTYAEIAKSQTVMDKTLAMLNIDSTDVKDISVSPLKDTQIITISIQTGDPELSANVANTLAGIFSDEVIRIAKVDSVEIVDLAKNIPNKVKPNIITNTLIAIILGGMIALGIVFLQEFLDKTIKTEKDIEKYLELPVLGAVIKYETEDNKSGRKHNSKKTA